MTAYLIETADRRFTKIGIAQDPLARLCGLQTGCPLDLSLYATLDAAGPDAYAEAYLHEAFSLFHERGEWFCASAALIVEQLVHRWDDLRFGLCGAVDPVHFKRIYLPGTDTVFLERRPGEGRGEVVSPYWRRVDGWREYLGCNPH